MNYMIRRTVSKLSATNSSRVTSAKGRIVKKGKTKVFTEGIPDMDIAEAVNAARHYTR